MAESIAATCVKAQSTRLYWQSMATSVDLTVSGFEPSLLCQKAEPYNNRSPFTKKDRTNLSFFCNRWSIVRRFCQKKGPSS